MPFTRISEKQTFQKDQTILYLEFWPLWDTFQLLSPIWHGLPRFSTGYGIVVRSYICYNSGNIFIETNVFHRNGNTKTPSIYIITNLDSSFFDFFFVFLVFFTFFSFFGFLDFFLRLKIQIRAVNKSNKVHIIGTNREQPQAWSFTHFKF